MNTVTTARGRAIAAQDQAIQNNIAKIEEAKQRPTAIQAMASRLNLTPMKLQETLRQTVFREANDAEFAALIVVANEYKLNPLLKEIYAFKAKGGGIIPYVSVDGWIRIINEHPQFDGIEFNDIIAPDGELEAIECVIWRKDRTRPIKVVEYMDECRRKTEPWDKSPKRFLRHRSIMQCGRVAFGFSGIGNDDDYEIIPYGGPVEARNVTPPSRAETRQLPRHDAETGEVLDEELSREEAEALDRQSFAEMEGRDDSERGDLFDGDEEGDDPARIAANEIIAEINAAADIDALGKIMTTNRSMIVKLGEDLGNEVHAAHNKRRHQMVEASK